MGHDLIEETPLEKRDELEDQIEWANSGLLNEGEHVLKAIQLLTWDKTLIPNKAEYIKHIAETAEFPLLAVKIADRLCNTLDFLSLEGAGIQKARSYFAAGEPLFEALKTIHSKAKDWDEKRSAMILADIEAVRSQLAAPIEKTL